MKMKNKQALIVKNITREGPGLLEGILNSYQIGFQVVDLYKEGRFPGLKDYSAIFVFGGPDSANDATTKIQEELQRVKEVIDMEIPYLGVCLGMQILVKANGGEIYRNDVKEVGWRDQKGDYFKIDLTDEGKSDPLFAGLSSPLKIFHLHGETVRLTDRMKLLATGEYCKNQVVKVGDKAYGIQGHLELTPSMLEEWVTEDLDLRSSNQSVLQNNYAKIRNEYEVNGRKIFVNFLRLARLMG